MREHKSKNTLKLISILFITNTVVYITLETDMRFLSDDYLDYFMNSIIDYVISIFVLSITYGLCFQYFNFAEKVNVKKIFFTMTALLTVGYFLYLIRQEYRGGYIGGIFASIIYYVTNSLIMRALDDVIHFTITTIIITALFLRRKPVSLTP